MRKINIIVPIKTFLSAKKRVAAYARVSANDERPMHSLSAQVSHYSGLIQRHAEWEYAGVYADGGISGVGDNRPEFKRLVADCEAGKIDIVLTKSISRFARNTVILLETVRRLRELGVDVWFERESIHSLSGDGELLLTILASFAQEESRAISENIKWSLRKGFKDGKTTSFHIYGYRWNGEKFIVQPDESAVVRMIFADFLNGMFPADIVEKLAGMGIKPMYADKFSDRVIRYMLSNEKYTGDLVLQKTFVENHITKKGCKNNGELPKYIIEDAHEAIIDKVTFDRVQAEKQRRKELGRLSSKICAQSAFSCRIRCETCGCLFYRSSGKRAGGNVRIWVCSEKKFNNRRGCATRGLREDVLEDVSASILGIKAFDSGTFTRLIREVGVSQENMLTFHFYDGRVVTHQWEPTNRGGAKV